MTERITSLERDGLTFDVFDEGPLDGEVVVLLHGFPERSTCWRKVTPLLHERGYRTIAMDQRGYSPGARPRRRWNYRIVALLEDAFALVDEIGDPVHLVGHDLWRSAGVGHGHGAARAHPHPDHDLGAAPDGLPARRRHLDAVHEGLLHRSLPAAIPPRVGCEQVRRARRHRTAQGRHDCGGRRLGTAARSSTTAPSTTPSCGTARRCSLDPRLFLTRKVQVPTTFVWSTKDVALDRRGAELTEPYVDAPYEFVVLDGVTHWVPTQAPEATAEAIIKRIESA